MRRVVVIGSLLALAGCMPAALTQSGQPLRYPLYFEDLSARLDEPGKQVVRTAADYAKSHPTADVAVVGFADPEGSKQANIDISRTRSQVVSDELIANGIAAARIHREAMGATPFAFSSLESRRVEISVLTH